MKAAGFSDTISVSTRPHDVTIHKPVTFFSLQSNASGSLLEKTENRDAKP